MKVEDSISKICLLSLLEISLVYIELGCFEQELIFIELMLSKSSLYSSQNETFSFLESFVNQMK